MIIKAVVGALGITIGLIISRLLDEHQINKLKDQLFEYEEEHNVILQENSRLVEENRQLRSNLSKLIQRPPTEENIPKFDD